MNDETTATATEAPPAPSVENFECIQCHKSFTSSSALAMHKVRVHTRAGILGARTGALAAARLKRSNKLSAAMRESWAERRRAGRVTRRRRQTKAEALAIRREHQRQVRAQWYAQGLDSHGRPYKKGQGPRRRISRRPVKAKGDRTHERKYAQGYYWRKRAAQGFPVPPDKQHFLVTNEKNGRAPRPSLGMSAATAALRLPKQEKEHALGHINFCPHCGGDLQVIALALGMMKPREE